MKQWLFFWLLLPVAAYAQVKEDFSDKDFLRNSAWTGDTAFWQITDGKLQSRLEGGGPVSNLSFHISTPSFLVKNTTWEFWTQLKFNTSSKNYVLIWLTSDKEDPRCGVSDCHANYGYYLKIGSAQDDIALYRKDSLKDVLLIQGRKGITNHSNNVLKVKVNCDEQYRWSLFTDETGTGTQYFFEGEAIESSYQTSHFFSIVVFQSGKTSTEKHFFDNISIGTYFPDTIPPELKEIDVADEHHINLLFSESLDKISAGNVLNYHVDHGVNNPESAKLDDKNRSQIKLFFEKGIEQKITYQIGIKNISDISKNKFDTTVFLSYYLPHFHEVIMSEIYPDPSHSHGLPAFEYVEIKNISGYPVNLEGWKFCNHTKCATLSTFTLQPNSFVLLCNAAAENAFEPYGRYLSIKSFPALNNSGDTLSLYDKSDQLIHRVYYDKNSYNDKSKSGGGWSLEMIHTNIPCGINDNWVSSIDPSGGTPAKENSVSHDSVTGVATLQLQYVKVLDSLHVALYMNTIPEFASASQARHFFINENTILSSSPGTPVMNSVMLQLEKPLEKRKIYTLTADSLSGCGNISQGTIHEVRFGIPERSDSFDIVINEILFHPRTGSKDFVELYNHSPKIIDLSDLQLANRNSSGEPASIKSLSSAPYYFFPGEYIVVTEDKRDLMMQYFCKSPDAILEIPSLPAYPNIRGTVILLNEKQLIVDEVNYDEKQHDKLLHNYGGVSLERRDDQGKSKDWQNWHSASSVAGYATPTFINSQSSFSTGEDRVFFISPKIFSPDGDGIDDLTEIKYRLPDNDYFGEMIIYDANGYLVRHLLPHSLLGRNGKIIWDGKNDRKQVLSTGTYIIHIKIFNPGGTVKSYKLPVVLVKKSR